MDVEVMFRETIKPSNPTPKHLRYHRVSLFDHVNSSVLMPLIFFFSPTIKLPSCTNNIVSTHEMVNRLKESLSTTLAMFYPLAGQIKDANFIVCNDEGVPYVQARVNCLLAEVVDKAEVSDLDKLLPCNVRGLSTLLLTVQVNVFACGGIALGVCINHKVSDAFSLLMFIKMWATIARGGDEAINGSDFVFPCFDVAKLFPSRGEHPTFKHEKEEAMAKRFVFKATKLVALQSKYSKGKDIVSTGLALLAFIYSRIGVACSSSKVIAYQAFQAVNVRSRIDHSPPANHFYFGNLIINTIAELYYIDRKANLGRHIVDGMRESTRKIDTDFMRKIQHGKADLSFTVDYFERAKKGEIMSLGFSNYSTLPTYESDFGWGRPVWVTSATVAMKNLVILLPSPSKSQIEVYVSLSKEDMDKLEADQEFNSFAMKPLSCKL